MTLSGIFSDSLELDPKYVLVGAPFDASSSFRPGSRLAPQSIRRFSQSLGPFSERGSDLSNLAALDAGDMQLNNRVKTAFSTIESRIAEVLGTGALPILLGGDHSVTIPSFTAAQSKYPNLRLLYLDAHPDLYAEYDGDPYSHACVVSRILELDGMRGDRITQMGIRTYSHEQKIAIENHGIEVISPWGFGSIVYESTEPTYISVDIDVLDPAHAPACGNPVPGGISMRELLTFIQSINAPIVGFDVVEVNPLVEKSGITELAAARIVSELIANIERV